MFDLKDVNETNEDIKNVIYPETITEAKNSHTVDKIQTQIGKAVETLDKLDKYLMKGLRGDKGPHDKSIQRIRFNIIQKALKALDGGNYMGEFKFLNEDRNDA